MYSRCIFCKSHLGSNVSVEAFPTGGRLAFDERQGRLWVICPHCARWNLSPIEERWEAIEECERLFGRTTRRVSTENIGLAVLPTGLHLIRIGGAKRPEMAAWRYGAELLRRRRSHRGGQLLTVGAFILGWPAVVSRYAYKSYVRRKPIVHTVHPTGVLVPLRGKDAKSMRLIPETGSWMLRIGKYDDIRAVLKDEEAIRVAGLLLPWLNAAGTDKEGVEGAVRQIERFGTGAEFFESAVPRLHERIGALREGDGWVSRARPEVRLALEMAAHEDLELQSLRGELATLERAWREAEEIGSIADSLLVPRSVQQWMRKLR